MRTFRHQPASRLQPCARGEPILRGLPRRSALLMLAKEECTALGVRNYRHHAAGPRTRHISETTACVVSPISARLTVAADERPLSHLAFGNHAAANSRCGGASLLRAVS